MIRTEEIREVPADVVADFCDFAKTDWSVPGWLRAALMSKIDTNVAATKCQRPISCVVGVYQTTLVGGRPELFLLFTNEFVEGFRGYARTFGGDCEYSVVFIPSLSSAPPADKTRGSHDSSD
jgi:hypothetical protein